MSTVRAINFQHPSASAANITLASDGTVTGGIPSPNRNFLYNGAMQVSQRGTSTASITTSGFRTADRWGFNVGTQGTWTQSVENDAPTGSGFRKSLKVLCTTADASPAAGDFLQLYQPLEGQDLQRIAKGTSAAQQLTLSFWVKSNVTGTYIAELYDGDNTRQVSASYTISASATWERKTITFPADTTGAFDNDNTEGMSLVLWLGAGTDFTGGTLNTTWAAVTANKRASGQTNLAAATNNYWQVTGVQLEVGSQATAFEFKSFGQELRECQRYYFKTFDQATAPAQNVGAGSVGGALRGSSSATNVQFIASMSFPVAMRAAPTITTFSPDSATANWSDQGGVRAVLTSSGSGQNAFNCIGATTVLAGGAYGIHVTASAEL